MSETKNLPELIAGHSTSERMPLNYVAAKNAIARCAKIDECKQWEDQAVALTAYAKQIKDKDLERAVRRIKLRAKVRMGELLTELEARHGGWQLPNGKMTNKRGLSPRYKAGLEAGIGRKGINEAVSMARVPVAVREQRIEASPPISPRALVDLGRARRFTTGRSSSDVYRELTANTGWGANLGQFCRWISGKSAPFLAAQLTAKDEIVKVRRDIVEAQEWLDTLDQHLKESNDE